MKAKKIIGEISKTILCLLAGLVALLLVYGSILEYKWGAIWLWLGMFLFIFLVYTTLAWTEKEGNMKKKVDKEFIKYVYKDVYKAPEAVISILKEEGLTEKQITKYMRKRDKYLNRKFKRK